MVCPGSQKNRFLAVGQRPVGMGTAGHGVGSGFVYDLCGCQPDRLETLGPDAPVDEQIIMIFPVTGNRNQGYFFASASSRTMLI